MKVTDSNLNNSNRNENGTWEGQYCIKTAKFLKVWKIKVQRFTLKTLMPL